MATELIVESDTVEVRLSGAHVPLALKRRLRIPTRLIASVEATDRKAVPAGQGTWLRSPGTHIPGLIRSGSYGRGPHRQFWSVVRQERVLVIRVRDWKYSLVVLGTSKPDAEAALVGRALAGAS